MIPCELIFDEKTGEILRVYPDMDFVQKHKVLLTKEGKTEDFHLFQYQQETVT